MKYFRHAIVVVITVTLILSVMAISQNRVPGVYFQTYQSVYFVGGKEKIQDGIYRMQTRTTTMLCVGLECGWHLTIDVPFTSKKGEPHVIFLVPGDDAVSITEKGFEESILLSAPEYLMEPIKEGMNPDFRRD